ncbi:hypothetical protein GCM10010954_24880 [Halobacillus andaensis]|uniref:Uncharacterized protein n=1 Tax=Halobacillus andaensis TaxID=1176239 RepID=A0A917B7S6_HALAA|nr:hypothetical protein [Halobacillus andaensis]MBP2005925.1 hypothetical protein [Halobacillus andaensis]GGF24974.1 hypothetical protein GCM10010954_24880 [Halobacillus andaensis]
MKWIVIFALLLIAGFGGFFGFIKFNPPLIEGGLGATENKEAVVISLGNKGMGEIHFTGVQVNSDESPSAAAFQVVDAATGFTISNDFENEGNSGAHFQSVAKTVMHPNTDPVPQNDEDIIYGLSVRADERIHTVKVAYEYFGLRFLKEVTIE